MRNILPQAIGFTKVMHFYLYMEMLHEQQYIYGKLVKIYSQYSRVKYCLEFQILMERPSCVLQVIGATFHVRKLSR